MTTAIDKKKESNHIDRLCKELGFPTSDHIPMEVVARYLNVSVRQARNLASKGFYGEKYGVRTWLIKRDEIIEFKPNKPKLGRPYGSKKK
jgi:hypothetical protein